MHVYKLAYHAATLDPPLISTLYNYSHIAKVYFGVDMSLHGHPQL